MAAKSKKGKNTKQAQKKTTESSFLADEIIIWLTLAGSLLLLISNFGMGGKAGNIAAEIQKNIFGWAAYLIPFVVFGIVAFIISNRGSTAAKIKAAAAMVMFVLTCTLLELISEEGGIIGSVIAGALIPAIGIVGTYVVVLICMIICIVIITGKSVLKGMKSQSGKAYEKARADAGRRKEASMRKKEERESGKQLQDADRKRNSRKVTGVSFDTTLKEKTPEVKELTSDSEFVINRGGEKTKVSMSDAKAPDSEIPDAGNNTACEENVPVRKTRMGKESVEKEVAEVAASVAQKEGKQKKAYRLPPLTLLKKGGKTSGESDAVLRETARKLQQTLQNFGVNVSVTNVSCGPSVTRYELQPEMGVKVSKIVGLSDDIKLNLAASDIRIEAPIPGKAAVGIEVPNKENSAVMLRDLLESREFRENPSKIAFAAGKDISGKVVVADIAKMPHLLIAGATGSGKSVCINTLIMSILYKASPDEVKLIMIDPKVVELSVYNGIPHLMIPVVTDPKKAAGALNWAVAEMSRRYQAFAQYGVRDMRGFNDKVSIMPETEEGKPPIMPQIVIIVDELADLMMVASGEVEEAICRLAQLARAAGIHLVLATQRPSVNVITGLIKANMPSRIAFSVSSGVDSRTIIDMNGAEKLLGKGDMLFYPSGYQKPARVQGSFVSDKEVQAVVDHLIHNNGDARYDDEIVAHVNTASVGTFAPASSEEDERDVYFSDAGRLIIEKEKASIGMLQRSFKIGFNRAARIMDQLCEAGVVGGEEGTKPRKILMTMEDFEHYMSSSNQEI